MSDLVKLIDDINRMNLKTLNIIETEDAGTFSFAIERVKDSIRSRVGDYEYMRKETVEELFSESSNLTLFGKPRIITIEIKNIKKEDKVIEKIPPNIPSTFIFIKPTGKVDAETLKSIRCNYYDLRNITYDEMAGVIKWLFEKHSIQIEPQALEFLMSFYSGNFGEIYNEVEKIIIYSGEKKKVTVEDVYRCVLGMKERVDFEEIFTLLLEGNLEKLLKKVEGMTREMKKEEFIYLMAYIGKHIDHIVRIKEMLRKGKSQEEIVKDGSIFLNPYLKRKYIKLSKNFKFNDLYRIYELLRKYDIPVKWGILSPSIQFEKFLFETLGIIR